MPPRYRLSPRWGRRAVALLLCAFGALALSVAEATAAAPARLLVLGDSLTAGFGVPSAEGFEDRLTAALAAAGHPVTIDDAAVSGDTTAGGRARLPWVLGDGEPDVAIVELGGNDGLRGLPTAEMEANLAAILDTFAKRHIPVLLAGMYAPPNLGETYGKEFRAVFERLAKRPGVIFYPFFLAGVAGNPALMQADMIHPNAAGVKIIVAAILPYVERLLAEAGKR